MSDQGLSRSHGGRPALARLHCAGEAGEQGEQFEVYASKPFLTSKERDTLIEQLKTKTKNEEGVLVHVLAGRYKMVEAQPKEGGGGQGGASGGAGAERKKKGRNPRPGAQLGWLSPPNVMMAIKEALIARSITSCTATSRP